MIGGSFAGAYAVTLFGVESFSFSSFLGSIAGGTLGIGVAYKFQPDAILNI